MSISSADILFRKPEEVSEENSNGGRMTATILLSGIKNSVFPDVRQAERVSGSDKWRKVFLHFAPPDQSQALDVKLAPWLPTPAQDRILTHLGTFVDIQSEIVATPGRAYGVAPTVAAELTAGATIIDVTLENADDAIFLNDDIIYVTDKLDINSSNGSEEYVVISNVTPLTGNEVRMTLLTPLVNSYAESTGVKIRVASVVSYGDVLALVSDVVVTSVSGVFDDSDMILYPASTIYDIWTLTFTDATHYDVVGAETGSVGTGTTGGTFAPNNAAFGGPYFSIPSAAFSGTWAANDDIVFTTSPAARALWLKRIIPAGAETFAANQFVLMTDLESA